jgi:hypothetical protein
VLEGADELRPPEHATSAAKTLPKVPANPPANPPPAKPSLSLTKLKWAGDADEEEEVGCGWGNLAILERGEKAIYKQMAEEAEELEKEVSASTS